MWNMISLLLTFLRDVFTAQYLTSLDATGVVSFFKSRERIFRFLWNLQLAKAASEILRKNLY